MSETTEYVLAKKDDLVSVADAIREKTGGGSPLGLSDLASLITDIETGGGVDEILSLFGANAYKIVNNTKVDDEYNYILCSSLDSIKSPDDIILLISIDNNYLAGVSPTIPTMAGGYAYAFVSLNVNGLIRVFVATTSANISDNSIGFSYNSTASRFQLDSTISGYEISYPNPMTSLVIYNVAETS